MVDFMYTYISHVENTASTHCYVISQSNDVLCFQLFKHVLSLALPLLGRLTC